MTPDDLNAFVRWLFAVVGLFLVACSVISSISILFIFGQRRFRQQASTVYIMTGACLDLVQTILSNVTKILLDSFFIDIRASSRGFCKVRIIIVMATTLAPLGCICLLAFDRFILTSRNHHLRRSWSTVTRAGLLSALVVAICFFLSLVNGFCYDLVAISPTQVACNIVCNNYTNYLSYGYNLVLLNFLPISVLVYLGIATRQNIRYMQHRPARLERQLNLMILLQVICVVISMSVFMVQQIYSTITASVPGKSAMRLAWENLASHLALIGFYSVYSSSLVIYLVVSSDIRATFLHLFTDPITCLRCRLNRIGPTETDIAMRTIQPTVQHISTVA